MAFEDKTQVHFSDADFIWFNQHQTNSAEFDEDDKFHIFDLPCGIIAGSEIGAELVERLQPYPFKKCFTVETKESETSPNS